MNTYHNVIKYNKIVDMSAPCPSVTVLPSANIFATDIIIIPATCSEPCTITVDVTYTNSGNMTEGFIPAITIDGIPTSLPLKILDPGTTKITFVVTNLQKGSHTICAEPIGTTTCQTFNVQPPVVSAGIPLILAGGLLIGFLVKKHKEKCDDYKTPEECHKNECQWKKKKCIPLNKEDKYLIAKLRQRGAVGVPICTGEECRIGKWLAVAIKGKEPIIIHDP